MKIAMTTAAVVRVPDLFGIALDLRDPDNSPMWRQSGRTPAP